MADDTDTRYWRRHAQRYDRVTTLLNRRFFSMARAVASAVEDCDEILEVAAGTGLVTEVLAPGARRLVATDTTAEMLDLLRRRLADSDQVEIQPADALNLDFADDAFDAVVIANLLHLLDEPGLALGEARRVLRTGGTVVVPTFAHGEGLLAQVVSRVLGLSGFRVVTRFRGLELDELVTASGFEVVEARWFAGILPIRFVAARVI